MRKPRFMRMFSKRSNRQKERARRLERIAELGFEAHDKSGWFEGMFASRRYILTRGEQTIGVYLSSREALKAAEEWVARNSPQPHNHPPGAGSAN